MRHSGLIFLASAVTLACLGALLRYVSSTKRRSTKLDRLHGSFLTALRGIASSSGWRPETSCVILSGGLDSSIVAEAGATVLGLHGAITVLATADATDRPYALASAAAAGLKHDVVEVTLEQLLTEDLPTAIKVLKSFDPMTLRNEIVVTRALSKAASLGYTCAVTGDAADELLGGYSFTHGLSPEAWAHNRARMAKLMKFGSQPIGKHFGMYVFSPYLDVGFIRAAMTFEKHECVKEDPHLDSAESLTPDGLSSQRLMGKWPLRQCFPAVTSCWRKKDPIEVGCGTTAVSQPGWFDLLISDEVFESESSFVRRLHGVTIRDKEHLHYYRAFRQCFPNGLVPGVPRNGDDPCPACGYQMSSRDQTFCVTCGHYDPHLRSSKPKSS